MTFSIVELDAVWLVLMSGREVSSHTRQDGVFLDECSVLVGNGYVGVKILSLLLGYGIIHHMNAHCREICHLIEVRVISCAFMSVECQFGHVAI